MSSYAAPRPLARPLLAVLVLLLLFATLIAAPPARAAEALEVEPNGSTATAQPLALGTGVAAVFGPSGDCDNNFYDCDVYRIAAPSAGRLVLDLRFSDSLGTASSFELVVQDARGDYIYTETISSADYDGSRLRGLGMYVDSGTSYVQLKTRVAGFSSGYIWSGQAYSLSASLTPGVVETEKNGTTATADVITLGQTIEGSIFDGGCNSSDCDYFRLQLPSPARLSIDFRFACDLGTGKVYSVSSYDNAGNRLTTADLQGSDCEGETLRAMTVAAPAGNVYFLVSARTGGVTAGLPYRLTVTRTDTPAPDVDVTRLAGSDRQGTAVEISKATFAPGVPVTYVATGGKFPDALAAAPAAATQGGPLLLVDRDTMSQSVRDELSRLRPAKIVVVGSALSVGDGLLNELRGYAGSGGIQRIGGVDRYDTADRIVRYAFPSGASRAWIATGEKFPDALGASAAAGSVDAPVLLVNGGQASAAPATRQLLTDLGTSSLTIAGSSLSVSEGIRSSLGVPSTRIGGTDRYDTSEQLNRAAFTAAETVYFATGENFPDALAGATAAGYTSSPLFAVRPDCVPRKVLDDITALGADRVILLGGPGTLSDDVARLKAC
ncbi:cell wall-binding repeat-containing protein [Rathayibacter sp. VKM Ac-2929]|uniref:cell wall-binding repeat-containing protein n=1 Tax=Rathayibacter sp. VKM Ac-2929 TaxID=2929480 RepID=UPI001FB3D752|nr:cell wall-binding repeat-containing protein [Rathayibacter sp. VKM Ac-2929]MCJ1674461.1 cell wall-binding repeat-containing protein [Rathayibacter sp. VKM Ac-2929]